MCKKKEKEMVIVRKVDLKSEVEKNRRGKEN